MTSAWHPHAYEPPRQDDTRCCNSRPGYKMGHHRVYIAVVVRERGSISRIPSNLGRRNASDPR